MNSKQESIQNRELKQILDDLSERMSLEEIQKQPVKYTEIYTLILKAREYQQEYPNTIETLEGLPLILIKNYEYVDKNVWSYEHKPYQLPRIDYKSLTENV